jgi:hypothetical protein
MVCLKMKFDEGKTTLVVGGGASADEDESRNSLVVKNANGGVLESFRLDDVEGWWIEADDAAITESLTV